MLSSANLSSHGLIKPKGIKADVEIFIEKCMEIVDLFKCRRFLNRRLLFLGTRSYKGIINLALKFARV